MAVIAAATRRALLNVVSSSFRPKSSSAIRVQVALLSTAHKSDEGSGQDIRLSDTTEKDDFVGIAASPFPKESADILMAPVKAEDVEVKPDGLLYLPEIRYRRILNQAFGPGGWALMPRGQPTMINNEGELSQLVIREFALYVGGRFVAQSVGEHLHYSKNELSTGKALESAKSNALMRCCKDLGVASELWDPTFVYNFKKNHCVEVWCENARNSKEKRKLWRLKRQGNDVLPYPWKPTQSQN
ncbi:uncharacterized protein TRIADDRAFT_55661 [Trichoplax adhaerens]|uniref:Mitochondrial genome maintenance protein MGM101 n=1 Tax=Trichoplax adhaerens TaxID=10228 RepID=B3RVI1_TRIAD|nr:hypothetical protein TRIADDRAFT_55661 [Trichoplax adhaerens]EDV25505.1 hypothetical protein TRIADDRAFT_55661 [Trichoplax adhaerens]|eukprot:XP_002111538.1 hypothetical protein TRIADDRAFT_55661 [Trichoplax adhaerens]